MEKETKANGERRLSIYCLLGLWMWVGVCFAISGDYLLVACSFHWRMRKAEGGRGRGWNLHSPSLPLIYKPSPIPRKGLPQEHLAACRHVAVSPEVRCACACVRLGAECFLLLLRVSTARRLRRKLALCLLSSAAFESPIFLGR